MPEYFPDWQEALEHSSFEKAVSRPFEIEYHGKPTKVEIIKAHGREHLVIAGHGFELADRRPTPEEIDRVKAWHRY